MVGPRRTCTIVDAGVRKPLDLQDPRAGRVDGRARAARRRDARPARAAHRRRGDAPLDLAGDLPGDPRARPASTARRSSSSTTAAAPSASRCASTSSPTRTCPRTRRRATSPAPTTARSRARSALVVEEMLKAGELPCLVATSSLELGIDMGAVDLVLQVESPKSVARGLQRIGRAGHNVGDTSKGRIFPKFRADLLECAVVVQAHARGRDRADRRAAQRARRARPADRRDRRVSDPTTSRSPSTTSTRSSRARTPTPSCRAPLLENVLDMLDGRYPSQEFGELRAAHRLGPRRRHDPRAQGRAPAGDHERRHDPRPRPVHASRCPTGAASASSTRRWSTRRAPGQTFLLGASTWRIEEIGRDRVIVTPAPGAPGAVPFWKGDSVGRPKELGQAIGAFSRWAVDQDAETLAGATTTSTRSPRRTCSTSCASSRTRRACVPSDRTIVVERFRDEIGDWRLCVLSPVRRARARGLGARAERAASATSTASSPTRSGPTTGSSSTCPTPTSRPAPSSCWSSPTRSRTLVVAELGVERAVRRALPRERRPRAAHPARLPGQAHAAVAAAPEVAVAARGRQALRRLPDHPRDLPRVPARRARRARPGGAAARRCTRASCRSSRSRRRPRRRSPRRCCSTTSRRTCTRATRPTPSGAPPRCRSTATCCASCSARRSCAT